MTEDIRHKIVALLPRLRRFAYSLTGDMDRADDLVQETCVRALSKLDLYEAGTRLDSWMYRIAQNLWLDRIRANKVRGEPVDIDSVHDLAGEDGRATTEGRLTLDVVASAYDALPPDQKVLVSLVCIDGRSYKDAAEILEIPIGTVMSRLARARRTLYEASQGAPSTVATSSIGSRRGRSAG